MENNNGHKPLRELVNSPGNWPEDDSLENGGYICLCSSCKNQFIGHKRRVVCKTCDTIASHRCDSGRRRPSGRTLSMTMRSDDNNKPLTEEAINEWMKKADGDVFRWPEGTLTGDAHRHIHLAVDMLNSALAEIAELREQLSNEESLRQQLHEARQGCMKAEAANKVLSDRTASARLQLQEERNACGVEMLRRLVVWLNDGHSAALKTLSCQDTAYVYAGVRRHVERMIAEAEKPAEPPKDREGDDVPTADTDREWLSATIRAAADAGKLPSEWLKPILDALLERRAGEAKR